MEEDDSPEARAKRRLARLLIKPPPVAIQAKVLDDLNDTMLHMLHFVREKVNGIVAREVVTADDRKYLLERETSLAASVRSLERINGESMRNKNKPES